LRVVTRIREGAEELKGSVSIGRAIANTEIYVLDGRERTVAGEWAENVHRRRGSSAGIP